MTPDLAVRVTGGVLGLLAVIAAAPHAERALMRAETAVVALHARRVAKAAAWDRAYPTPYQATTEATAFERYLAERLLDPEVRAGYEQEDA